MSASDHVTLVEDAEPGEPNLVCSVCDGCWHHCGPTDHEDGCPVAELERAEQELLAFRQREARSPRKDRAIFHETPRRKAWADAIVSCTDTRHLTDHPRLCTVLGWFQAIARDPELMFALEDAAQRIADQTLVAALAEEDE